MLLVPSCVDKKGKVITENGEGFPKQVSGVSGGVGGHLADKTDRGLSS